MFIWSKPFDFSARFSPIMEFLVTALTLTVLTFWNYYCVVLLRTGDETFCLLIWLGLRVSILDEVGRVDAILLSLNLNLV